jgi:arylsulfatase A-like enzyme
LRLTETTLAEALKREGYVTACVGKWHLGGKGFLPTEQGFDWYHAGHAVMKPTETEGGKGKYDLTRAGMEFMGNKSGASVLSLPGPQFSAYPERCKNKSNRQEQ